MSANRIGCASLLFVFGCAICFLLRPSYDEKTADLAKQLSNFTPDQWREIYVESERIFSESTEAERLESKPLDQSELPLLIQDLGFDRCSVVSEGVFYERTGGGWHLNGTWIHSIHRPNGDQYRRIGIWFDGFRREGWVYPPGGDD